MEDRLKVKDIIQKLKNLDCPLLGSGEDAWVTEMLFKQNFDRYHLMEWIFSKLDFSIARVDGCQNSSEVKVKNLLAAISALGLCSKDRADIIQGSAPFQDQLNLWKLLVDILWKKCSCSSNISEASSFFCDESKNTIDHQYQLHRQYKNKLCESVNLNTLFKEKIQLFPAYLLKECKENLVSSKSTFESLNDIRTLTLKNSLDVKSKGLFKNDIFQEKEGIFNCNDAATEESLNKLEEDIGSSLAELQKGSSTDFDNTYTNLKLYLNVPADESIDLGPPFQTAKCELENFFKLNNALSTLKSSESELKTISADLNNFEVPSQPLSDPLLRDYIGMLSNESKKHTITIEN